MNRLYVYHASTNTQGHRVYNFVISAPTTSEAFERFVKDADRVFAGGYSWTKTHEMTPVELADLISADHDRLSLSSALAFAAAEYGPAKSGLRKAGDRIRQDSLFTHAEVRTLRRCADKLLAKILE